MERKNRSDSYQHIYSEIAIPYEQLCKFMDETDEDNLELEEARSSLIAILLDRAKMFTPMQWAVLHCYFFRNMTQVEVAKELGVNQSSVHKSMFGNVDYRKRAAFGGSLRKLRKLVNCDPEVRAAWVRMREAQGRPVEADEKVELARRVPVMPGRSRRPPENRDVRAAMARAEARRAAIRADAREGASVRELSRRHGVSPATVRRALGRP